MKFRAETNADVDDLNRKYGAPGRIVFTPSPTGFPIVAMACQYGSVRLSLYGAHVLDYRPTGHAPVLFMSKATNLAPGTAIRGGIPVCWPWFGRCGEPGSGAHGFARKSAWQVTGTEYSEEESTIRLRLVSTDETRKLWPHDFVLDYTLTLSMKLTLSLKTSNTGADAFSITEGFHPYFRVMERDHVTVRGLDGCEFCDARVTDVADRTWTGDLRVTDAFDHVFTTHKNEFALLDPDLKRAIAMVSLHNKKLIVWNPGPVKEGDFENLAPDEYRNFVCVEPATLFRPDAITIPPGQTHELIAAIQSVAE
ncbi:MAG: D-hexose-6-phosphate mutarotase [Kiritimatiellae bacterium]|nr:D-hexose-6-phosphate mutarotase [Kiritimatiellia bacterium]